MPPSIGIRHALGVPDGTVVKNAVTYSASLGIVCGELSQDAKRQTYQRFFYIESMTTGRIDDGSEDFRSHAANVCVSRD